MAHADPRRAPDDGLNRIASLGYGASERAVLTIARYYCAAYAAPQTQSWIAGIGHAMATFDAQRGPAIAVAVLAVTQTLRQTRRSVFRFNAANCACCSEQVTDHERLLISALRACLRGDDSAAAGHAFVLCEGNEAQDFLDALSALAQTLNALR